MRLGPLSYQSAFDLLRAKGYQPVAGSSRFEDERGRTGRIVEAEGRGDTWYAEAEESDADLARVGEFEENSGTGTFTEGFAAGRHDRETGHTRQLCTTGTGERPPVVKRQGRDYYHGYKAAAEGATSEPSAHLTYRAKHRGTSGMAANGGSSDMRAGARALVTRQQNAMDRFIEYAMDHAGLSREEAERALAVYRREKVIKLDPMSGQFNFKHGAFGEADVLQRAARMTGNPVHLKLDGNFSFGIGSEDDKTMKTNMRGGGEVIESKRWRNTTTGQTASPYGAVPWTGARGDTKADWEMETVGWTIRWDDGTVGTGHLPDKTREEAKARLQRIMGLRRGHTPNAGVASCDECGGDFEIDGSGVANHLTEDGDVDYDADADHVPYSSEHEPNAARGHCRICGNTLPSGEVICAHHEREGLSNDPRWADLPSWEEARGRIHGGQHSLVENARKNVSAVINAFEAGRSHSEATCSTDGDFIYSYALPIAARISGEIRVLDPKESPSATTSGQIRAVMAAFPAARPTFSITALPGYAALAGSKPAYPKGHEPKWMHPNAGFVGAPPHSGYTLKIQRLDDEPSGECFCGSGEAAYPYGLPGHNGYVDAEPACAQRAVKEAVAEGRMVPEHESNARGSKAWFGDRDHKSYAIKIDGVVSDLPIRTHFPASGPQGGWPEVEAFKASARSTWLRAKHDRSGGVNTVKRFVKSSPAPDQFYAKWTPGDDSLQIWYTVPEGAEGHEPNWRNMLDLPGVERRLGADRVAAVLSSVTPHAVALGLAGDASDANDVGAYEAYTSLARMIDDGDLDDLIRAAKGTR